MNDKNLKGFPTSGPFIESIFENNSLADGLYAEVYVPAEGNKPYIYWCSMNFGLGDRGAYVGIQHKYNNQTTASTFNNICSFWDKSSDKINEGVKLTWGKQCLFIDNFGREGTGLHTSFTAMNWKSNTWYGSFIRRWEDETKDLTYISMFMYDYETKHWSHYLTVSMPGIGETTQIKTDNITGFLENFYPYGEDGKPTDYSGVYRNYFKLNAGSALWSKPNSYKISAGGNPAYWTPEAVNNNTAIKVLAGGVFDNNQENISFELNQEDKPANITKPLLTNISRIEWDQEKRLIFSWEISAEGSPQLSIKGFLTDREGNVLGPELYVTSPELRRGFLDFHEKPEKWSYAIINLQIIGVFNEASETVKKEYMVGTFG